MPVINLLPFISKTALLFVSSVTMLCDSVSKTLIFRQLPGLTFWLALAIMAAGAYFAATDNG